MSEIGITGVCLNSDIGHRFSINQFGSISSTQPGILKLISYVFQIWFIYVSSESWSLGIDSSNALASTLLIN